MARDILGEESDLGPLPDPAPQVGIPPRRSIKDLRMNVQQRLGANNLGQQPQTDNTGGLDDLLKQVSTFGQQPPKEHLWSGTGKAFMSGLGSLGADVTGAGEYALNQTLGPNDQITQAVHGLRTSAQSYAQSEIAKLTPQEQDEMTRQWTTLDPHQTIWQGGPSEFVHTVALHAAAAAPATAAMLWPAGRLIKAGMTAGALTYVGATQTGLSMGSIANNIADDIDHADENTLRQNSPRYSELVNSGMPPEQAKQQLIVEAQKYAPVVGGLVSGAIATVAGRFLTPVLSKEGASLGARLVGGAADQAIQGGGSAGADYIARETAAQTYDKGRAPDLVGAGKAAAEGAATGAIQGAGFAAISGHGKVPQVEEAKPGHDNQNPGEVHANSGQEEHLSGEGEQQNFDFGDTRQPGQQQSFDFGAGQEAARTAPTTYDASGQGQLNLQRPEPQQRELPLEQGGQNDMFVNNGVPADQAAAIQARHPTSGHQGGGAEAMPGPNQPAGFGMQEANGPQQNLDLRGGQMNPPRPGPTPPVAAPAQLNLNLRQRMRGGAVTPPVAEAPRTVADQLRQRAADQQPPMRPDVNQPDLFKDQPVPGQLTTLSNRPNVRGQTPSPETVPHAEVASQLDDLVDPSNPRKAVLMNADTLEHLRQVGTLDALRDRLGDDYDMVPNFDRKGGALVADPETAREAVQLRDNKVATPEEIAEHLGAESPDQNPAAVLQRAGKAGIEQETAASARATKETTRAVSRAAEGNITGDDNLAQRATQAAGRDLATGEESPPVSREEAARRLTAEARRVHNESRARAWPGTGVIDPSDLVFSSPDAAAKYRDLHNEFLGTQVMRRSTVHPQDAEKGRVGQEIVERRIQTFLKTHAHETKASQVARAAVEVSREGVRSYVEDKRAPGREYTEPHQSFNPEVLEAQSRPTRAEVHEMSDADLHALYNDVVERATASPRSKLTADQIRAEDDEVRSKMEKRINRYFRTAEKVEELGHANSEKFAVSPRRALTERETRVNDTKVGTKARRLIGYKTFDPEALMSTVESQREMERAAKMTPEEQRTERANQWRDLRDHIEAGEKHLEGMLRLTKDSLRTGDNPLLAHRYMRELLQYGRVLKNQSLRSPEARAAAKKFNTLMDTLGNKSIEKRAQYLIDTFKTELARQDRSAMRASANRTENAPFREEQIARANDRLAREETDRQGRFEGEDGFINKMDHDLAVENERLRLSGDLDNPAGPERGMRMSDQEGTYQYNLPFEEKVQPKLGYRGKEPSRFTTADEDELRDLLHAPRETYRGDNGKFQKRPSVTALTLKGMREAAHNRQLELDREAEARQNLEGDDNPEFSAYQLRHEAEVARRRAEDGLNPEIEPEPFAGRQAEHEGEVARRQREEDEELRSALEYPQKPNGIKDGAAAAASELEQAYSENRGTTARDLLPKIIQALPEGSQFRKLFEQLQRVVEPHTLIGYADQGKFALEKGGYARAHVDWHEQGPIVRVNRDAMETRRALGEDPSFDLLHALGHELAHVATTRAIMANPEVRNRLEAILQEARRAVGSDLHYGTRSNNVNEMVAEAYSNRDFQKFLDGVQIHGVKRSLWERFKQIVSDILGFSSSHDGFTALDAIMREHGTIFRGKQYSATPGAIAAKRLNLEGADRGPVGNAIDRVTKSLSIDKDAANSLRSRVWEDTKQGGLGYMTPRQQSAQFSKYFEQKDGTNPYKRYWDTFFKRAADNAVSMEKVGKISNQWSNLEDRYGIDTAARVSKLMHDATLYQFHPDLPLTNKLNEHLTEPEAQARQKEGAAIYSKLPPEWQEHYQTLKKYYSDEQRNTTDQIVLNGLHAMLTKGEDAAMTPKQFDAKYDAAAVRRLGLDTHEGLQKEFGDSLSGASQDILAKIGSIINRNGPYFPLMRNGDYVVSAERKLSSKEFDTSKEAQAYASAQRGKDPTLSVSVRATEDGTFRVQVSEKEVRMAESKSEANQHRRDMAAVYGEENVKPVQLKADLYKGEGSITTGSALDSILRKLDDNPAAQTAIKDFYLRSLGDQSFRKRELQRSNRRGVSIENQHRSFAQYGRSQSYYLSQLKYGRHLANAQGEVQAAVSAHRDESQVSAVRMGQFARELSLRDEISRNPYKVSDLVRKGTSLTQFMMLTSPSHWFVRGAQPYVLSAPWLGARHGFSDSVAALGRAQSMIADPLLKETASSALGLKALFSRAAAERSYSVIDQVLQHIKANAGPDADKIASMIQHLRDNNLIDLSMATELSDISKGKSTGLTARVLDASRIMLHLIEVNNRVMTAVAARELGLKAGMTEAQAVEHAADAINVTHNDYSYGNTPRAFMAQSKGLLGGARPLLFQFMKYPQQVYGMMISSGLAALKGKTMEERQIGVKTLAGVLATHLVAAGAVGATLQPIKWAFGALMAGASALGMTDQPYTVANALSGDTYDTMLREVMNDLFGTEMGELASKGLPAALGVDLSQRMALGSTYNFHLKTDSDASTIGSIAESVGGPWLNVAENFFDAGKAFLGGDVVGGIQKMSPHLVRDLVKAGQMSQKGVMDNKGETLIPADKLSPGEIFAQSLGFRPDAVAETLDRNQAEKSQLYSIRDQQKALIAQYAAAPTEEKQALRDQIKAFNQQHPAFAIQGSNLIRAQAQKAADDLEMQKYGVRARAKQLPELARAGAPYNVGS